MESSINDHISTENLHREMQLRRENESTLDVPEVGEESSEKVTKKCRSETFFYLLKSITS